MSLAGVVIALACLAIGVLLGRGLMTQHAPVPDAASTGEKKLWTCSMHPQVIQDHPGLCPICHMALTPLLNQSRESAPAIDAAVVQSMGVRTARVTHAKPGRSIRAYGSLMEREPDHRDINLRVSGWIETLNAAVDGAWVAKGDPLFTLSSPELAVAIEELRATRKQRDAAGGAGGIGATLYAATARKLVLMGLDETEVERLALLEATPATVTIKSPMKGHVTKLEVVAGAAVKSGDRILRLADNAVLWLDLRVPSRDIGRVVIGSLVHATVDAYPGETFEGRVTFFHPHFDMDSQTALVRAEIDNAGHRLRESQSAVGEIEVSEGEDVLVVPRAAVIDTGKRALVFVALGAGRFEPREIVLGRDQDSGVVEVKSGVAEGEEVVASGQFLLDSESRLRESVLKFLSSGVDVNKAKPPPRPDWADGVDVVVERYLTLSDALGLPQTTDAPLDARALAEAARDLVRRSHDDPRVVALANSAEPLVIANLTEQRELFKKTSEALLDLIEAVPPSEKAGGPKLFVLKCPMAPGRWLQRDPAVKNPYFGTTMKECGSVVGPVLLERGRDR